MTPESGGAYDNRMTQIAHVTGTAFVVAEFRRKRTMKRLRSTGIGRRAVSQRGHKEGRGTRGRQISTGQGPGQDSHQYLDDVLETQILSDVRQVVILGAGLDTRAVRKPAAGVRYFGIDDAATLNVKLAGYRARGIEAAVTFIPGNYVTDGVIDLLRRHDFDFGLPTYFIWEGNTMYLPLDRMRHVLAELTKYVTRFRVSFDYMAEAVISRTTGDAGITRLVESFAAMKAPWLSGIRDIQSLACELGLTLIENVKTAELHQRYWVGRSMSSPIFHFYSVCTMGR